MPPGLVPENPLNFQLFLVSVSKFVASTLFSFLRIDWQEFEKVKRNKLNAHQSGGMLINQVECYWSVVTCELKVMICWTPVLHGNFEHQLLHNLHFKLRTGHDSLYKKDPNKKGGKKNTHRWKLRQKKEGSNVELVDMKDGRITSNDKWETSKLSDAMGYTNW